MKVLYQWFVAVILFAQLSTVQAQNPGLEPYIPSRIEWLTLLLNSQLRHTMTTEYPYNLEIINTNQETLLIFVVYGPNMDRRIMNNAIDTAREVIQITVKNYGWDNWVKIKEQIEMINSRAK